MSYSKVRSNQRDLTTEQFVFWTPASEQTVKIGPDQTEVPLPGLPLPINRGDLADGSPSDSAIGQGVYDYLRQFPDCEHNRVYAELLRDSFPHLLSDLAAHAVMLDAKEVDPAYVLRKLTALKILRLLEPDNKGLLHQISRGFYELALTLTELPNCRRYLLEAMRAAHQLHKLDRDDLAVLQLLAEIDMLFCDYPSASRYWERLRQSQEPQLAQRAAHQLSVCQTRGMPERTRVDDLEDFGHALQLYGSGNYSLALSILERLEESPEFVEEFPSADFFYLLGMCRKQQQDRAGAFVALHRALEIVPDYQPASQSLDEL